MPPQTGQAGVSKATPHNQGTSHNVSGFWDNWPVSDTPVPVCSSLRHTGQAFPTSPVPSCPLAVQVASPAPLCSLRGGVCVLPAFPFLAHVCLTGCLRGLWWRQCPVPTWTNGAREVATGTGGHLTGGQWLGLEAFRNN